MNSTNAPALHEIYFYLTHGCNLQCAHCWLSKEVGTRREDELSAGEIKDVIDQAIPLGLRAVKLTGGEPFLRDDIVDIVRYADQRGLSSRVESNGILIDEGEARAFGELQHLHHVGVSLDGATPESNARLRGVSGSFQGAIRGIRRLVDHGVQVEVIASLHRANAGELASLAELAAELGVWRLKLNPVTETGRGRDMAARGELLSVEEVIALNGQLEEEIIPRAGISIQMSLPVVFWSLGRLRRDRVGQCGVLNIVGILPDGTVSICGIGELHEELVFGSVRQEPLQAIWQKSARLAQVREEIAEWPQGLCQRCLVRHYCALGYCRAGAYEQFASLGAPYPFCQLAYDSGSFPVTRLGPPVGGDP